MSDAKKAKLVQPVIHVQDPLDPSLACCGDAYAAPVACPACVDRVRAVGSVHVLSPKSADRSLCGRIVRGSQIAQPSGYVSVRRYDDLVADPDAALLLCKFCVANLDRMRSARSSPSPGVGDPAVASARRTPRS